MQVVFYHLVSPGKIILITIITINIFSAWKNKSEANNLIRALTIKTKSDTRSYPEVIEHNSRAQDIPVQGDQVRLEGFNEETRLVSVDVQTVALQQLLLVPPALRPVLRQLLYLQRGGGVKRLFFLIVGTMSSPDIHRHNAATLSSFCSTMSDRFPSLSSLSDGLRSRCCWPRREGKWAKKVFKKREKTTKQCIREMSRSVQIHHHPQD